MGIYDRDYNRGDQYDDSIGYRVTGPQTVTMKLIIVTGLVYLAQRLSDGWVTGVFELYPDWYRRPYEAYQLLTYGFLHAPTNLWHIVLNMLGLWFFGPAVEQRYGAKEFLTFYLLAIVVAGLVYTLSEIPFEDQRRMLGASGATTAVLVLFAFNFPHQTGMFMMLFPMPMWMIAVLVVAMDAVGTVQRSGKVAVTAHLGGALFAALYYKSNIRFAKWLRQEWSLPRLRPGPKLRVHDPDEVEEGPDSGAVDDILRKIQEQGQDSLTRRERKILEQASREYQKRRK